MCLPRSACRAPKQSNFLSESLHGAEEWVFCGSALSSEEKVCWCLCFMFIPISWYQNISPLCWWIEYALWYTMLKSLSLCGTLQCLLVEFGSMIGVPVTKFWRPNVTHVIAAADTEGACTRTLKVLMAILNGRWVLTIDCELSYLQIDHCLILCFLIWHVVYILLFLCSGLILWVQSYFPFCSTLTKQSPDHCWP